MPDPMPAGNFPLGNLTEISLKANFSIRECSVVGSRTRGRHNSPMSMGERSGFGNHAFVEFNAKIYDACAEPHLGKKDRSGYINHAINHTYTPPLSSFFFFSTGDITDINDTGDVTDVE